MMLLARREKKREPSVLAFATEDSTKTIRELAELERRWQGVSTYLVPKSERKKMSALRLELLMSEGGSVSVKRKALAAAYGLMDTYLLLSEEDDLSLTSLPAPEDYYYAAQNVLEYLEDEDGVGMTEIPTPRPAL